MTNPMKPSSLIFSSNLRVRNLILAFGCALVLMARPAKAQTFSVLHTFTGGADGAHPYAGLTVGGSGILYGTTVQGGTFACGGSGCGVVFKLTDRGSGWTLNPLYEFNGGDGANPYAGVVDLNGVLYGTTALGGTADNGTVFKLRPPATACKTAICYWSDTVLYSFGVLPGDGAGPAYGNVTIDRDGNIYGTTGAGGPVGCGTVWKLTPSGGGGRESILYGFNGGFDDGCQPLTGVIFDTAGNLYGNTWQGGGGPSVIGTVYELTPQNGTWMEKILVAFTSGTGGHPNGTLIMDSSGNLYGTATDDGPNGGGTVYELSRSDGGWTFSLVYGFSSGQADSCHPNAGATLGPDGNLYGVCTTGGAHNYGWVFEMPPNCNQTCTPDDLHDFDSSDGSDPTGPVVFDASGNLYGTASQGAQQGCVFGCGVVWEIAGVANTPRH